jgi:hypothetical protein
MNCDSLRETGKSYIFDFKVVSLAPSLRELAFCFGKKTEGVIPNYTEQKFLTKAKISYRIKVKR